MTVTCRVCGLVRSDATCPLVPFDQQSAQLLGRLGDVTGLERHTPSLRSVLTQIGNLDPGIETITALPEITKFTLATVKNRGKTARLVHDCLLTFMEVKVAQTSFTCS